MCPARTLIWDVNGVPLSYNRGVKEGEVATVYQETSCHVLANWILVLHARCYYFCFTTSKITLWEVPFTWCLTVHGRARIWNQFFYFLGLLWIFIVAHRLSLVAASSGFSCCGAWALGHTSSIVVAPELSCPMCMPSLTKDGTHVPCIGRQILNHWTMREILLEPLLIYSKAPVLFTVFVWF